MRVPHSNAFIDLNHDFTAGELAQCLMIMSVRRRVHRKRFMSTGALWMSWPYGSHAVFINTRDGQTDQPFAVLECPDLRYVISTNTLAETIVHMDFSWL